MHIQEIIMEALKLNPSDLHISIGIPPICRCNGKLCTLPFPNITPKDTAQFIQEVLSEEDQEELRRCGEVDSSFSSLGYLHRMRLNVFRQRGTYCMAFRVLNQTIPTFQELGLPVGLAEQLCRLNHGLVLVTGPTGTGKTTTITAMLDWINNNRSCHIVTIEDPIEYYHKHNKSIIHQRETGQDTANFSTALRSALRQDPDIIFVGEMRDLDSISAALTAAETGHLVFSTLHTIGAAKTIDRIIDVFPTKQQQQIRTQLSMVLQGIISQQLIASIAVGNGRELAYEVLLTTPAVRNMIRDNKVAQIGNSIITGTAQGMCSMETCLAQLVRDLRISYEDAMLYATQPEQLEMLLKSERTNDKGANRRELF